MDNHILLSLAGVTALGIACQWFAWWTRLPAILFLLITGIIIGPAAGLLDPDKLLGDILFPAVSLSVAVILFEGSLTLKFEDIRGLGSIVRNLISIGALITWLITAFATHYLLEFPVELACLFGAVVVVTGPTVIMPMLRTVRPNAKIANILRWEGIVIDPLGALLAVLVYEFIVSSQSGNAFTHVLLSFASVVFTGLITGFVSALALGVILRRHLIPEYLRSVFSLSMVLIVFAISDHIEHESGLLSVTVMGIVLANMKNTNIDDILDFKESVSILLISILFIVLAARVEFYQINEIGLPALWILAILMLIARPLSVFVSSIGSDLAFKEKLLIAWIGPRGIVAAAVASIFALRLADTGYPEAEFLVPLTFIIIIGTVVIQSATSKLLAKILNVREPAPTGVLIIGAGNVARAIGKVIQDHEFKVLLTDSNWENISQARMAGLTTYYGNPVSEHAESHLDLVGLGRMLAMSGRANHDALANLRFKSEFGENSVYELNTTRGKLISDKHRISTRHRGYQLFGEEITYGYLASWLRNDAEIKSTQLSSEFDYEKYISTYQGRIIPLFAIDNNKRLQFFVVDGKMKPEHGWIIISLIMPENSRMINDTADNSGTSNA